MMGKDVKILIIIVLSLFLCVSSFAQNKIAIVAKDTFYDEKTGITELVVAYKKLEEEFEPSQKELKSVNEKLLKFIMEVDRCARVHCRIERSYEESQKMMFEAENLSKRIKEITDDITPRIKKRKIEIIEPINKRIAEKLELYRTSKNYKKIYELGYDNIDVVLYVDKSIDVTKEFIKFCNEEFEKEKSQKQ